MKKFIEPSQIHRNAFLYFLLLLPNCQQLFAISSKIKKFVESTNSLNASAKKMYGKIHMSFIIYRASRASLCAAFLFFSIDKRTFFFVIQLRTYLWMYMSLFLMWVI